MRRQAEEQATMPGLLLDLAERGSTIVVRTTAGRSHQGRLTAVATDCCVLRSTAGPVVLLPLWAVASVRHGPGQVGREASTSRDAPLGTTLAGILADLAGDRPRVRLAYDGGTELLAAELRAVGEDVLTVRIEADPPATVYVRVGSLSEVSLLGSG